MPGARCKTREALGAWLGRAQAAYQRARIEGASPEELRRTAEDLKAAEEAAEAAEAALRGEGGEA